MDPRPLHSASPNAGLLAILFVSSSNSGPDVSLQYPFDPPRSTLDLGHQTKADTPNKPSEKINDQDSDSSDEEDHRYHHANEKVANANEALQGGAGDLQTQAAAGIESNSAVEDFAPDPISAKAAAQNSGAKDHESSRIERRRKTSSVKENKSHAAAAGNGPSSAFTKPAKDLEKTDWHHLYGFSKTGLAALLAPSSRIWDGKKTQLTLKGKTFVGRPVRCHRDGTWRHSCGLRKHADFAIDRASDSEDNSYNEKNKPPLSNEISKENEAENASEAGRSDAAPLGIMYPGTPTASHSERPLLETPKKCDVSIDSSPQHHHRTSTSSVRSISTNSLHSKADPLTVFNVVCVISSTPPEHQRRVDVVYEQVVRRLARGLNSLQATSGWVQRELNNLESLFERRTESEWHAARFVSLMRWI